MSNNTFAEKLKNVSASTITKMALVLVLIIFLAIVYNMNNAKDVPLKDIESELKEKTDIKDLKKCNTRELLEFIGIDYSNYDEVIYYKSGIALDVKEILIVKAKEKSDLDAVEDAVETRINDQINTYRDYGPKQVAELKNAVVIKRGKYLFYAVSPKPEKYEEVFAHAV